MRPTPANGHAAESPPGEIATDASDAQASWIGTLPWTDPVVLVGMAGVLSLLIAALLALKNRD
jgi:hypothetical protein